MNLGAMPIKHQVVNSNGLLTQEWASALSDIGDALAGEWRTGESLLGDSRNIPAVLTVTGGAAFISMAWDPSMGTVKLPFPVHKTVLACYAGTTPVYAYAEGDSIFIPTPGSGTHHLTGILLPIRS